MRKVIKPAVGEKSRKAFTLIELLIVIAIIGILAAVIFVSLSSARKKAQDAQVKSDITSISKALEMVKIDRDLVKTSDAGGINSYLTIDSSSTGDNNFNKWKGADGKLLVTILPKHPISANKYELKINDTSGYSLIAKLSATKSWFCNINGSTKTITAEEAAAKAACQPN